MPTGVCVIKIEKYGFPIDIVLLFVLISTCSRIAVTFMFCGQGFQSGRGVHVLNFLVDLIFLFSLVLNLQCFIFWFCIIQVPMTVFWGKGETLLIVVVMVGSSYTELLANADFHVFLFVQISRAAGVLLAFCSRNLHSRESPHNKNAGSFYGWRTNVNFQTVVVALAACLFILGWVWHHWMKKFPEKLAMLCKYSDHETIILLVISNT